MTSGYIRMRSTYGPYPQLSLYDLRSPAQHFLLEFVSDSSGCACDPSPLGAPTAPNTCRGALMVLSSAIAHVLRLSPRCLQYLGAPGYAHSLQTRNRSRCQACFPHGLYKMDLLHGVVAYKQTCAVCLCKQRACRAPVPRPASLVRGRPAVHSSGAGLTGQRCARGRPAGAAASSPAAAPCRPPQCPARGAPSRTRTQRPEAPAAAAGSPLRNCVQAGLPVSVAYGDTRGHAGSRSPCLRACNIAAPRLITDLYTVTWVLGGHLRDTRLSMS